MKLIILSGPTSAGKDAVINELIKNIEHDFPGKVAKAEYYKARQKRDDEKDSKYFISPSEFNQMRENKIISETFTGKVADYHVGYDVNEFKKSEIVVVNIDDEKARLLKDQALSEGDQVLTIFLHANVETRKLRYRLREQLLFDEPAQYRMDHDVTDADPENHKDFDLVIENKEDQFEQTMEQIRPKVKEFLNA